MNDNIYENKDIANFHIPRWNELPNIDLYLDQVVCFIDDSLSTYIDIEKEEHIITKTMINNYVKHSVIYAPINKKYNKEHISRLFVICILKQLYSISDISKLISLATKKTTDQVAYDKFCDELENAISITFAGSKYIIDKDLSLEDYILRNVVFSFSNKLYVEKVYLNKF